MSKRFPVKKCDFEVHITYVCFKNKVIWHQKRTSSEGFIFLEVVGDAMELSLEADVENSSVEKFIDST